MNGPHDGDGRMNEPTKLPSVGILTSVRCFKRIREDDQRCGVWLMTAPECGAFFHDGDRDEVQRPSHSLNELDEWARGVALGIPVEEITPEEAVEEFKSWPRGQELMIEIFGRHAL
jgi:hypothetical protein